MASSRLPSPDAPVHKELDEVETILRRDPQVARVAVYPLVSVTVEIKEEQEHVRRRVYELEHRIREAYPHLSFDFRVTAVEA